MKKVDFISPCPAIDCSNPDKQITWTHTKCGSNKQWVWENGDVQCSKCEIYSKLWECCFACRFHQDDYRKFDTKKLRDIAFIMAHLKVDEVNEFDIIEYSINLYKSYQNYLKK